MASRLGKEPLAKQLLRSWSWLQRHHVTLWPIPCAQGFGLRFIICYALGMVSVIFGLFNVVTALFVESTLSALKYNELQRKKARQYETRWVQQKLEQTVEEMTPSLTRTQGRAHGCSSLLSTPSK